MTAEPLDLTRRIATAELLDSGASYRQLDYWWRRGYFLRPGETRVPEAPGCGTPRDWTMREYAIAALIVRFTGGGLAVAVAADMARDSVDNGTTTATTSTGVTISWAGVA